MDTLHTIIARSQRKPCSYKVLSYRLGGNMVTPWIIVCRHEAKSTVYHEKLLHLGFEQEASIEVNVRLYSPIFVPRLIIVLSRLKKMDLHNVPDGQGWNVWYDDEENGSEDSSEDDMSPSRSKKVHSVLRSLQKLAPKSYITSTMF